MKKTLLVARYELVAMVLTFTFLFTVLGLPLISFLVIGGISSLNPEETDAVEEVLAVAVGESEPETNREIPDGYVDQSGLIQELPPSVKEGALKDFPDEDAARRALERGEINVYYLVPEDYLTSGELICIQAHYNPIEAFRNAGLMHWILKVNLLGGDEQFAAQLDDPLQVDITVLEPTSQRSLSNPLTMMQPYVVLLSFFVMNMVSASSLLFSIRTERRNRILEVLVSSLSPHQLFTGKLIGQGLASLFRTVMWIGSGYILVQIGGRVLDVPEEFLLQPNFLVWSVVFFLLGYAVYASIMAGIGALAPYLREVQYVTLLVFLPMYIPVIMLLAFIRDPNGAVATFLSLFPLTAPLAMVARLAATNDAPTWQVWLSASLLGVTAVLTTRAMGGLFRAQIVLAGEAFNPRRIIALLAGRG